MQDEKPQNNSKTLKIEEKNSENTDIIASIIKKELVLERKKSKQDSDYQKLQKKLKKRDDIKSTPIQKKREKLLNKNEKRKSKHERQLEKYEQQGLTLTGIVQQRSGKHLEGKIGDLTNTVKENLKPTELARNFAKMVDAPIISILGDKIGETFDFVKDIRNEKEKNVKNYKEKLMGQGEESQSELDKERIKLTKSIKELEETFEGLDKRTKQARGIKGEILKKKELLETANKQSENITSLTGAEATPIKDIESQVEEMEKESLEEEKKLDTDTNSDDSGIKETLQELILVNKAGFESIAGDEFNKKMEEQYKNFFNNMDDFLKFEEKTQEDSNDLNFVLKQQQKKRDKEISDSEDLLKQIEADLHKKLGGDKKQEDSSQGWFGKLKDMILGVFGGEILAKTIGGVMGSILPALLKLSALPLAGFIGWEIGTFVNNHLIDPVVKMIYAKWDAQEHKDQEKIANEKLTLHNVAYSNKYDKKDRIAALESIKQMAQLTPVIKEFGGVFTSDLDLREQQTGAEKAITLNPKIYANYNEEDIAKQRRIFYTKYENFDNSLEGAFHREQDFQKELSNLEKDNKIHASVPAEQEKKWENALVNNEPVVAKPPDTKANALADITPVEMYKAWKQVEGEKFDNIVNEGKKIAGDTGIYQFTNNNNTTVAGKTDMNTNSADAQLLKLLKG